MSAHDVDMKDRKSSTASSDAGAVERSQQQTSPQNGSNTVTKMKTASSSSTLHSSLESQFKRSLSAGQLPVATLPDQSIDSSNSNETNGSSSNESTTAQQQQSQAPSSLVQSPPVSSLFPPLSKDHTLFIFDWDDTILPTTWLALHDMRVDMQGDVPPAIQLQLDAYAPWAIRTLEEAEKYGTVIVVTNAESGWIELTVRKFFPSWDKMIQRIPYHSARSTWEPTGCSLPLEWKVRSFATEIDRFYRHRDPNSALHRRNIIGLGDSTSDREAMLHVTLNHPNTIGKSLKFMERPNLEHLQKQHHLIASSMRQIALHEKPLDLCIQHQPEGGAQNPEPIDGNGNPMARCGQQQFPIAALGCGGA